MLSHQATEALAAEVWQEAMRRHRLTNSKFRTFQKQYRDDPLAFVHDCVGFRNGGPTPYQDEILAEFVPRGRVAVRGPHGLGKTAIASWIVLWSSLTEDDCKTPTTASAWRHLTKFLWPEIHKWARRLKWDVIGRDPLREERELLSLSVKRDGVDQEAMAVASNNAEFIEGCHAHRVVYVFDEAKAIPNDTWDAAEGAFSGAGPDTADEAFALAISTPGAPQGRFYDIHSRKPGYEDWWARHVTLDEAIAAGRISREWAEQRKRQWGEGSAAYQNRVVGEFASSAEDTVITLAQVEHANELWYTWRDAGFPGEFRSTGVDVGRGGDPSVQALRFDDVPLDDIESGIMELRRLNQPDTMSVTGAVKGVLDKHGGHAVVDVIGIGAGVVDRLREQDCSVVAFNAGEATQHKDESGELGFFDKRSAAWWGMRERLAAGMTALPPDDSLTGQLTAPRYDTTSRGQIKVESKKQLRKADRLGRSTDDADAVIQAYWEDVAQWDGIGFG